MIKGALGVSLFVLTVGSVMLVGAQRELPIGEPLPPIEIQKLRPNLLLVTGAHANTVVFLRSTDIVMIDTKGPKAGWGRAIADRIRAFSKLPITTIINTSASGSYVGGNPDLAVGKVEIIAQEYAAVDMRKMRLMFTKPAGGGLPTRTFKDRLTIGGGGDRLELYYFGPATNRSCIFVVVPSLRVLLTGAAFPGKFLPALNRVDGGDGLEYPNTLTKALALTRDIEVIIPGQGAVAKPEDLSMHRDFMRDFLESTRRAKKAGKSAAAAARAWKLPARYAGYEAEPARVLGAIEWIYRQLP